MEPLVLETAMGVRTDMAVVESAVATREEKKGAVMVAAGTAMVAGAEQAAASLVAAWLAVEEEASPAAAAAEAALMGVLKVVGLRALVARMVVERGDLKVAVERVVEVRGVADWRVAEPATVVEAVRLEALMELVNVAGLREAAVRLAKESRVVG